MHVDNTSVRTVKGTGHINRIVRLPRMQEASICVESRRKKLKTGSSDRGPGAANPGDKLNLMEYLAHYGSVCPQQLTFHCF
jgi:hypothetical protein